MSDVRLHPREITLRLGDGGVEIETGYLVTVEATQLVLGSGALKGVDSADCSRIALEMFEAVSQALNKAAGLDEDMGDKRAL